MIRCTDRILVTHVGSLPRSDELIEVMISEDQGNSVPQAEYDQKLTDAVNGIVAKQVEQITAGVTRPKVTLRDVRNLLIAVPSMKEQERVLDRVVAMESRIQLEMAEFEKLSEEKSGLMDDLLTGRVRVTPLLAEAAQQPGSA